MPASTLDLKTDFPWGSGGHERQIEEQGAWPCSSNTIGAVGSHSRRQSGDGRIRRRWPARETAPAGFWSELTEAEVVC